MQPNSSHMKNVPVKQIIEDLEFILRAKMTKNDDHGIAYWYCLCVPKMELRVLCHISAFLVGLTQILFLFH